MSLADLIRQGPIGSKATAIQAIEATDRSAPTTEVAPIAQIAIAPAPASDMQPSELRLIGATLDRLGITDSDRWRVVDDAQADEASRAWWAAQATDGDRVNAERDDRRLCSECTHRTQDSTCDRWQAVGFASVHSPVELRTLHRCVAFQAEAEPHVSGSCDSSRADTGTLSRSIPLAPELSSDFLPMERTSQ